MTELDRLLAELPINVHNAEILNPKFKSLRSQIESKLTQADKYQKLTSKPFSWYEKHLQEGHTVDEDWNHKGVFFCKGCNEFLFSVTDQQELSQLRPIVEALREQIEKLEIQAIHQGRDFSDYDLQKLYLLKKILASSDKNTSSEVKQ